MTLAGGEGEFVGVLVDADDETYVFDDCSLMTPEGPQRIAGRMYVDRVNVPYVQELQAGG